MPTNQPRVSAVVEQPLYQAIERLAAQDHMSLSQKVRDLLLQALEIVEDVYFDQMVEKRRKVSQRSYSLSEAKRKLRL